jgi:hypothetical protein
MILAKAWREISRVPSVLRSIGLIKADHANCRVVLGTSSFVMPAGMSRGEKASLIIIRWPTLSASIRIACILASGENGFPRSILIGAKVNPKTDVPPLERRLAR